VGSREVSSLTEELGLDERPNPAMESNAGRDTQQMRHVVHKENSMSQSGNIIKPEVYLTDYQYLESRKPPKKK